MITFRLAAVLLLMVAATGCADPIAELINQQFPPVTPGEQRQRAIDTTADALKGLTAPTVAMSVSLPDALTLLRNDAKLREAGITGLALSGEKQLLLASATFARTFSGADGGNDSDLREWLERLKPEIVGGVSVYSAIATAVQSNAEGTPVVAVRLVPGVSSIRIERLKFADGKVDATLAADRLVVVLNRYLHNVSGELARADFTQITVPAAAQQPFRLPKTITASSTSSITIGLRANPIDVPVKLDGIASLIDDSRVVVLAQTSFVKADAPKAETVELERTFEAIEAQFRNLLDGRFDMKSIEGGSWVVIRKDLVATGLNAAFSQADACFVASGTYPPVHSSTKIPLPDGSDIGCSSNRDCSQNKDCSYTAKRDTRNCRHCLLRNFGGGCVKQGNDPFCVAAKATQNGLYEADAAAKKLDCERNKEMSRIGCEAEKITAKGLCEAGKETLKLIAKTGNFANLTVNATFSSKDLKVCLRNFAASPSMDNVSSAWEVTGGVDVGVNLKFVPLDIVGHLACQFPWTEKQTFRATLRDSLVNVASSVHLVTDPGLEPRADFATGVATAKAKLSPSPTEYLLTSVNMTLACQGLNLLKPFAVALTPFVPELRGDIDLELDAKQFSVKLGLPEQTIVGQPMKAAVLATPYALRLVASPVVSTASAPSR